MEDIIGRKIIGFIFKGGPGVTGDMKKKIGKTGVIESTNGIHYMVRFSDGHAWCYPYPELLSHMLPEEKEIDLNKLFNNVIKLIKIVKL